MPSDPTLVPPLVAALAAPYALMLAAPGPNLLVVLRASLAPSHARPIAAALGIACGATTVTALAAYSASFLMPVNGLVEYLATIVFSAILFRSALRLLFQKPTPKNAAEPNAASRLSSIFALGFFAALTNPMSMPFFISFFVANPAFQTSLFLACSVVFVMATSWFSTVGVLFAKSAARNLDASNGLYFRRVLALLMVACATAALVKLFK